MDSIGPASTTHEAKAHSILVVSEELDELFEICDRIALITNGRLPPAKLTKQTNVGEIAYRMIGRRPGEDAVRNTIRRY